MVCFVWRFLCNVDMLHDCKLGLQGIFGPAIEAHAELLSANHGANQ